MLYENYRVLLYLFKGSLPWHFWCFLAKTMKNSFFPTLTQAKNVALKFRTKASINFLQEGYSMVHFWFYGKDGYEAKFFKMQSISILAIHNNREQ